MHQSCSTCGLGQIECLGHFGCVDLTVPIFHPAYLSTAISIMNCICKKCSHFLLNEDDKKNLGNQLRNLDGMSSLTKKSLWELIEAKCKNVTTCPHCSATNGRVRETSTLEVVHVLPQVTTILSPNDVLCRLSGIPEEERVFLLLEDFIPSSMFIRRLAIPPNPIRPPFHSGEESDLTISIQNIVAQDINMKQHISEGWDPEVIFLFELIF